MRASGATARGVLVASLAVLVTIGVASIAPALPELHIKARLLTLSDLPPGWHSQPSTATDLDLASTPCLRGLRTKSAAGAKRATSSFVEGSGLPALAESLSTGGTGAGFERAVGALARCHSLTLTVDGKHVKARITKIALPVQGTSSYAFSLTLTVTYAPIGADIVLFRTDGIAAEVIYLGIGMPTPLTAAAFVSVAVSKAEGQAVSPPQTVSVVSAPVKIVHTAMGTVGYREVGSGPPLVMIMGFSGTMATWDPRLVDALAHDYEVVIFDNAGIGHTQELPAPLTIDEMAEQTSALITTLGLGKPDVLGWSMGTMIAQALAVLHPTQVNRLVLCAGYPGTGTVEPSQKAIDALTTGTPAQASAVLYPANQRSAATGYAISVSDWPTTPGAPAAVVAAQEKAITTWWKGADPAGQRTSTISAPTLIADGSLDRLDPQANSHRLQTLISGSQLSFYPDAGHAFLFQDETMLVPKVESFLGG
jgi:pimeloyl-ACP methyl ester carboxylesterase